MNRRAVAETLIELVLTMIGGAAVAAAESPAEQPQPPAMSVWMRFEDPARLDRCFSLDSWPADCAHGTLAPGRFGQALSLPGKGANGVHLPRPTAFFGRKAHAGTIALWVCPANPDADFVIADFYLRAGNSLIDGNQIVMHCEKGKLIARPCVARFMTIDTPLRRDTWTHLTLTWDSTRGTRLFVNGEKRAQGAPGFEPTVLEDDWPGRIGGPTGAGAPLAGRLDELRLYNRMLSDEDRGARVIVDFMKRSGNSQIDGHQAVICAAGGKIVASPALTVFRMEHAAPLAQGKWTHLAMSWDSRLGATLHVNGKKVKERVGAFTPVELDADWPGRVGCMTSVGGAPFAGTLDELRLFN